MLDITLSFRMIFRSLNRTRDLPACSTVPQSTEPRRATTLHGILPLLSTKKILMLNLFQFFPFSFCGLLSATRPLVQFPFISLQKLFVWRCRAAVSFVLVGSSIMFYWRRDEISVRSLCICRWSGAKLGKWCCRLK